jgi:hypothetical protein
MTKRILILRTLMDVIFVTLLSLIITPIALIISGAIDPMNFSLRVEGLVITAAVGFGVTMIFGLFSIMGLRNSQAIRRNEDSIVREAKDLIYNSPVGNKYRYQLNVLNGKIDINHMTDSSIMGFVTDFNQRAIYINVLMLFKRVDVVSVVAHEMVHLLQNEYYGIDKARKMYNDFNSDDNIGYKNNPFEVEARSVQINLKKNKPGINELITADTFINSVYTKI